jgi:hypothetical protein
MTTTLITACPERNLHDPTSSGPRCAGQMDTPAISTLDRLGQSIQRMPVFADEPGNADRDPEAQGAREPGMYRAVLCRRSQASMNKPVSAAKRPAIHLRAPHRRSR